MTGFAIVSTTVADAEEATRLARRLVQAKLAACVQIAPITSIYRWKESIEEAREHVLTCKIASADFEPVAAAIRAQHSYDVPEIVATPIIDGDPDYLAWLAACGRA